MVAVGRQLLACTAETICAAYSREGYGSMNNDAIRNNAYKKSIESRCQHHKQTHWLEIGCGASAWLTRMVLEQASSNISAIEVNRESALTAQKILASTYSQERFEVIQAMSTDHPRISLQPDIILHEILGYFASSEGLWCAVSDAIRTYLPKASANQQLRVLPSRAATFFCPVAVQTKHLHKQTYCSTKIILTRKLSFADVMLSRNSRYFEFFDFSAYDQDRNENPSTQEYSHVFEVQKEGDLNGLGAFIWADAGVPSSGFSRSRKPICCNLYPYGDDRIRKPQNANTLTFSSNTHSAAAATNWRNPVILLEATHVHVGWHVHVKSTVILSTNRPQYDFEVSVQDDHNSVKSYQKVHLSMDDLYEDMEPIKEWHRRNQHRGPDS